MSLHGATLPPITIRYGQAGFPGSRATARAAITRSRTDAIKQRFDDASGDAAATWRVVRDVLHHDQRQVHSDIKCQTLASGFSQFILSTNWRAFVSPPL